MKILVTGANGQLGQNLKKYIEENNINKYDFFFASHKELDITKPIEILEFFENNKFDLILNFAAYTNVKSTDLSIASTINCTGVKNLADYGIKMIHISTDFVFDGEKETPYTISDKPNPLNVYGVSKYLGELAILNNEKWLSNTIIIRTSWLFSNYNKNFFNTVKNIVTQNKTMTVVNDQIGSPTYAIDLIDAIIKIIDDYVEYGIWNYGLYQFSNDGSCSWFEFAKEIAKLFGKEKMVFPISTKEYNDPIKRPKYSVMENNLQKTRIWQKAVKDCFNKQND